MKNLVIFSLAALLSVFIFNETAAQIKEKKGKSGKTVVTQAPLIEVKLKSVKNILCHGDNKGSVDISIKGGKSPYKYKWSNGAVTQDIKGVPAGVYKVMVVDALKCPDSITVTVTQASLLVAKLDSVTNINCYGYSTGAIDISVTGGVPPYFFSWNNGATTEDVSGVTAGNYSLLITDANNCQDIVTTTIKQKPRLKVKLDAVKNILCYGESTGAISISAAGGVAPYTYRWTNGATTQDISGVPAGQYSVKITDATGCQDFITANVKEEEPVTLILDAVTNILCYGENRGAVAISVKGGVAPYTYAWSNGATKQDITGVPVGNYSVSVTDANGCSQMLEATITQPPLLSLVIDTVVNVLHYGDKTGAVKIKVSGGGAPYTYSWSNGAKTKNIKIVPAGSYSITVKDASGCAKTINASISQPPMLVGTIDAVKNVMCYGDSSGAVLITATGGIGPYKYRWSNGASTADLKRVTAGRYSVTITDAHGFKETASAIITQPSLFILKLDAVKNVKCYGDKTGIVDISVSGGVAPYAYKWNNLATTQDLLGVQEGSYSVTVRDAKGCTRNTSAKITQPPKLDLNLASVTNIKCYGESKGAVDITIKGGVAPYTYDWNNGAITQDISRIAAGNYSLTVTEANGCANTITAKITQPPLLELSLASTKNIACYGDNKGAVNIRVTGGVSPYTYKWSNGATSKDIPAVTAGKYSVTINDANGCTESISASVKQPPLLVKKLDGVTNIRCYGESKGAVNITVTGGSPPYIYKWSNGAITQDITGIPAGKYSVSIKDSKSCRDTVRVTVTQRPLLVPELDAVTDVLCYGNKTGKVNISVSGGVASYTYNWSNGAATQDINNLPSGTYSVTIKDAMGCMKTLDARITQPPLLIQTLDAVTDILCYGDKTGEVNITVRGGVPPYTYGWNNGGTTQDVKEISAGKYSVTIKDANGCTKTISANIIQPPKIVHKLDAVINNRCYGESNGVVNITVTGGIPPYSYKWNNGATTQDISGAPAGKYSVQISESNGCTKTLSAEITQPPKLVVKIDTVKNINCYGERKGAVLVKITGGAAPYTYSWSNGAVTKNLTGIAAGSYTLTVTDDNGCIKTVSAKVIQPPLLTVTLDNVKNILCNGGATGAVSITVRGGVGPYAYKWSNGAATQDITGLTAGSYSVIVTDAKGCTESISANVIQPPILTLTKDEQQNISCYGDKSGSVNITLKGGVTPYTYSWSNGATTQDLAAIPAGSYKVTVTDANGCKVSLISAVVSQPPLLILTVDEVKNILNHGESKGVVKISVSGGSAPYTYSWSNGAKTQDIIDVPAGNYSVTVQDARGCVKTQSAIITQPPLLVLTTDAVTNIKCYGNKEGEINISAKGGVPPYTYSWSNGATTQDLKGIPAGAYSVTITDANGYKGTLKAEVKQPPRFKLTIDDVMNLLCYQNRKGVIDITVSGGVLPYSYNWSNGGILQDITGVSAGAYSVTVTDANGCKITDSATITQPSELSLSLASVENISCYGESKGEVKISVKGGVAPYAYSWSNGATSKNIAGIPAGNYSVNVTDAKGCVKTIGASITQPILLTLSLASVKNVLCNGEKKGAVSVTVTGGSAPYRYSWSSGDTIQNMKNVPAGNYSVTLTDAQRCVKTLSASITEPPLLSLTLDDAKNIRCNGGSQGAVKVRIKGGVAPYSYSWSNGATTRDISGVTAGKYSLNVTDNNVCIKNISAELAEPPLLTVKLDEVNNIMCHGGTDGAINISVAGGVAPYTYRWNNGAKTEDLKGLYAGEYSVKIKDANGCMETITATISRPPNLILSLDNVVNARCHGDSAGEINITITGGVAPYTYEWNNGATTQDLRGIYAGNYTVKIKDNRGCIVSLTTAISQPSELFRSVDAITHIPCNGEKNGLINITVTGGVPPYIYAWNNGATTQDIAGLPAGDYSVKITESNGCATGLAATINEPPTFAVTLDSIKNVLCYGDKKGAVYITAKGGVLPYKYSWSNGSGKEDIESVFADSYSAMVTDANGCMDNISAIVNEPPDLILTIESVTNVKCCGDSSGAIFIRVNGGVAPITYFWSHGAITKDVTGLKQGSYSVTATDANRCKVFTPLGGMTLYELVVSEGKFISRDILFDVARSTIKSESFAAVNKIAVLMREHQDLRFSVEGHTDSDGDATSNKILSEDRAKAIKKALVKFGVNPSRLKARGWGESKPVDTNLTSAGKANNRRVEFVAI